MNPSFKYFFFLCFTILLMGSCKKTITSPTGTVKLTLRNMVNASPMVLGTAAYTNPFGEMYTISKFRYYISNVYLMGPGVVARETESYHLVDQSQPGSVSFGFELPENTFSKLGFIIGVDSIRNSSGAQTGALDPLNDMFWTWNSGYVMAKMEGTSPSSTQFGNKIEYHIGGFSGSNNVIKTVTLAFPAGKPVVITGSKTSEIFLDADFNTWWQSPNDIKIAVNPVCTTPGVLAKKIADNYEKMFSITNVVNN